MVQVYLTRSRISFRMFFAIVGTLVFGFAFSSCYPDYGLNIEDYDAVATYYDAATDFGAYKKYFLIDTVRHVLPPGTVDDFTRVHDNVILAAVEGNLEALGYVRTTQVDSGDIAVQTAVTRQDYLRFYSWGWYGRWFWPIYYPPVIAYNYSTGTITIDMADGNASRSSGDVKSVWFSVLQGVAGASQGNEERRIRAGINQAFTQSPYLGARN